MDKKKLVLLHSNHHVCAVSRDGFLVEIILVMKMLSKGVFNWDVFMIFMLPFYKNMWRAPHSCDIMTV